SASAAAAAPGEPRVLQGTLEWPATVGNEPFVVLRGEDGRLYYADISGAQRRTPDPMRSGSRIAAVGVEGAGAHEVAAIAVGAGDAGSLGVMPPGSMASLPPGSMPSTAVAPGPPADSLWRLDGTVQSVSGTTVTVRKADGGTHAVDASSLNERTLRALRPGDRVSFFGVPRTDRRLVANGYIQSEAPSPSASPRSTR